MRAEDLRLEELVRFSEGLVDLHGRRLIILDLHALGQFRRGGSIRCRTGQVRPTLVLDLCRLRQRLRLILPRQEQEIMRVGEARPRKVDIRAIAATNRDIK